METAQQELDQQLDYINKQQDELNNILDIYEKQVQSVYEEHNLQQPIQLADVQREKAYGLAETLNSQLDDVNRNLSVMIDEINAMGGAQQGDTGDEDMVRRLFLHARTSLSKCN